MKNILFKTNADMLEKTLNDVHIYVDMDGTANEWDSNGNPHDSHYFLYRKPIPSMIEAMHILYGLGLNIAFATSAYTDGTAMIDKRQWANKIGCAEIPIIYIPYGQNKDDYLTGKVRILIDDHTPNLIKFSGDGIKFINPINHKNGVWNKETVSYKQSGTDIALTILSKAISSAINVSQNE